MKSKVPLSDYADILMGQSPKGDTCSNKIIGLSLLNGPTEFGSRYPTPIQFTTDPKKTSKINDILFCVRGSTTGRMNYSDQVYAIGRGIASIRGKNGYPTVFVRGLIERNLQQLLNIATGSTFPNVSRDMINSFEVENVSKENAVKIAHIFSTLDDKIELNRKMNGTLEEMAQAMFKSWFVNFDPVYARGNVKSDAELEAEKMINPLLEKLILNRLEINSLQRTRDTLLPKLLSGELDVPNILISNKENKCQ